MNILNIVNKINDYPKLIINSFQSKKSNFLKNNTILINYNKIKIDDNFFKKYCNQTQIQYFNKWNKTKNQIDINLACKKDLIKYYAKSNTIEISNQAIDIYKLFKQQLLNCIIFNIDQISDISLFVEKIPSINKLKQYQIVLSENINYSKFNQSYNYIIQKAQSGLQNNINVYNYNIPLQYYIKNFKINQYNICLYDIVENSYKFQNLSLSDFCSEIYSICDIGFKEPIKIEYSNNNFIIQKSDQIKILIAKFLQIPTIPVLIYSIEQFNQKF